MRTLYVAITILFLAGCQSVGYHTHIPKPEDNILTQHHHPDRRIKPFPYTPAEIGLTAGEFTEFMRQRIDSPVNYSACC